MTVDFYTNNSDARKLNKSIGVIKKGVHCELKDDSDVLRPTLTLARISLLNYPICNYMYINSFKRYYFIKFRALVGDMLQVETIDPDPLMSFGNQIRSLYTTIIRQENVFNKYFVDNELAIRQTKKIQLVSLGAYNAGTGIYLTVDGGKD